jgi:hypothetical protein
MKEIIILSLIAFACTTWVFNTGAQPQSSPIGIKGVATSSPAGNQKVEEMIGDFKITDGSRVLKIRTSVYDDHDPRAKNRNDSDFPLSGSTAN